MLTSVSLATVPFVSSTDSTRTQMVTKQINQSVTHPNCVRPLVISKQWPYLTNTSRLYRAQAKSSGAIIYSNDEFMIVLYDETGEMKQYEVPEYRHTSDGFCTKVRYRRDVGEFKKGEILYEYDCFNDSVPTYGYNLNTMFFPFFGFNFEDCIVISESAAKQMRYQKIEKILIPIYTYSIFKPMYPNSKYKFLPEIGQTINDNIIAISVAPIDNKDPKSTLRSLNLTNFASIINDTINFKSEHILTNRIKNAVVTDIKIHRFRKKNHSLIDKNLQLLLDDLVNDYRAKIKPIFKELSDIFSQTNAEFVESLIHRYYIANNPRNHFHKLVSFDDLDYVIELELVKEDKTKIGDKLTNRYASKGVVNLIIPDELRPYNTATKEPIDVILGPLSVFARQNFGQILEGLLAKAVKQSQDDIIKNQNINITVDNLYKLSEVSKYLNNSEYTEEIITLADLMKTNEDVHNSFIENITNGGLFFEAPDFCKIDVFELQNKIQELYGITTNDSITIKRELIEYIKNLLNLDDSIPVPETDIVYDNIYNSPMYIVKLKQLANTKISARDVGVYSQASKQPIKDAQGQNKGSHLGSMEFDACIAHNNINTVREFHTVKSDCIDMKHELLRSLTSDDEEYKVKNYSSQSYVKKIIDACMTFLSEN